MNAMKGVQAKGTVQSAQKQGCNQESIAQLVHLIQSHPENRHRVPATLAVLIEDSVPQVKRSHGIASKAELKT